MTSASAAEAGGSAPAPGEPFTEKIAEGVHAYIQPDGGWCAATERRTKVLRTALAATGAPAPPPL